MRRSGQLCGRRLWLWALSHKHGGALHRRSPPQTGSAAPALPRSGSCSSAFDLGSNPGEDASPVGEDSWTSSLIPLESPQKQLAQAKLINREKLFLVLGQRTTICVCLLCGGQIFIFMISVILLTMPGAGHDWSHLEDEETEIWASSTAQNSTISQWHVVNQRAGELSLKSKAWALLRVMLPFLPAHLRSVWAGQQRAFLPNARCRGSRLFLCCPISGTLISFNHQKHF